MLIWTWEQLHPTLSQTTRRRRTNDEDAIEAAPELLFQQPVTLLARQHHVYTEGGERHVVDLAFLDDQANELILVELKRGKLSREHEEQIRRYLDHAHQSSLLRSFLEQGARIRGMLATVQGGPRMKISMSTARQLALHCQGLDGQWALSTGKEGVAQTIERLGYVQIDTIAVVERAHHHTLWARRPDYRPQMLHELQAQDRRIFEWWAPAMSYVPMSDYRYYAVRMGPGRSWHRKWHAENVKLVERVLERVREEGPLGSADFKPPKDFKRGTWWSWKPAKRALEVLFDMGELMVTERRNFQRIYDLRERVLSADVDTSEPTPDEVERFEARRALGGLGFALQGHVRWARWGRSTVSETTVQELIDQGEVTPFEIEGTDGQLFYALTHALDTVAEQQTGDRSVHILSPFDNLVIQRGWLETFFGFAYKLEAYTPAAKRRYGYFCLPILWGERFVGRMDSKADRKPKTFLIRKLTFEPEFADYDALLPALAEKVRVFATFNGCERVVVEQTDPEKVKMPLIQELELKQ